jgi:hypothetical protein
MLEWGDGHLLKCVLKNPLLLNVADALLRGKSYFLLVMLSLLCWAQMEQQKTYSLPLITVLMLASLQGSDETSVLQYSHWTALGFILSPRS